MEYYTGGWMPMPPSVSRPNLMLVPQQTPKTKRPKIPKVIHSSPAEEIGCGNTTDESTGEYIVSDEEELYLYGYGNHHNSSICIPDVDSLGMLNQQLLQASTNWMKNEPKEMLQYGKVTVECPLEIHSLAVFREVFSMDTWKMELNDQDREQLIRLLPSNCDVQDTLTRLFDGAIFQFGNPIQNMFKLMREGMFQPDVRKLIEEVRQVEIECERIQATIKQQGSVKECSRWIRHYLQTD